MGELLVAAGLPTIAFGLFAVLALRYGAESRPGFDERPQRDDRPNWPAIARSGPPAPRPPAVRPTGGTPARARATRPPAARAPSASGRGRPSRSARPAGA